MYGVLTALGRAGQNVYVKRRRKVVVSEVLNLYVSLLRFLWSFFLFSSDVPTILPTIRLVSERLMSE